MKQHAHPPTRPPGWPHRASRHRFVIAGEPLGLAEIALGVACGVTLAVTAWCWVVLMVAVLG